MYSHYVIGNPDGSTGNGASFVSQLKLNMEALHHGVVMGAMYGWNFDVIVGTGSIEQPQYMIHTNGIHRIRLTITWNSDGNPESIFYQYTDNIGDIDYELSFVTLGRVTYTYDSNGNVTNYVWTPT